MSIDVLREFLDTLPADHRDRPGVQRAIEILSETQPPSAADLVEMLRQAETLLGDARCGFTDPRLNRTWGQQRRRLRDRILDVLAGAR